MFGDYYEELSLDPAHVRMEHLTSGRAKFLAAHDMRSLDSVIGVIESADIGSAKIRFAKDEISERNLQKVRDGILTDISVGYHVETYQDISKEGDETPTYRATDWTPMEISLVPMGFDPGAVVRSETQTENDVEIITRSTNQEVSVMDEIEKKRLEQEKLDNAKKEERVRASEIRKAVREAKLAETLADELIDNGVTIDQARTNISMLVRYAKEQEATQVTSRSSVEVVADERDKKREGFQDGLLARIDRSNFQVTDAGKQFAGKSLLRMCEDFYGRRLGESDYELAKRAMSSSDFPLILANVAEKSVQKRYSLLPRSWSKWAGTDTLRNFKEHSQLRAGDFSSLEEMNPENGEYQYGSFSEENEKVSLKKHGKIHKFTEAMLINDDTGLIQKVVSEAPVAVARLENRLVYSALTTNKTMADGTALYHADHGNLGSAGAISETTFSEAFEDMRNQTSVDGEDKLNVPPSFLICGAAKETEAKKFLQQIQANQTANVNIFANSVELVIDAEISGNQYYLAADKAVVDTVKLFRLEGQEAPQVQTRLNWSDDSVEFKVKHFAVAAPMDFRGLYKNAGN
jgi:hypothetical protein